ncbi:MAG TPA: aminoacyl-tRNA hydrolase [Actinomycetota bacterium]|nr:aminoacyl-tRNA hydrolase [Actinomycetota bacterium]
MKLFRRSPDARDRWIIVGLGNPGERYATNRHNAGAMVLHELLERASARLKSHKSGCLVSEVNVGGQSAVLARPMSYMNESGRPIRELLRWYKVGPERLIVVHDELDVPFGEVRLKSGGGTAGHNGLASLASHLGTKDFLRVRVGISRPPGRQDPADYVLSDFSAAQKKELSDLLGRAADAVERIVQEGAQSAMNEFNARLKS